MILNFAVYDKIRKLRDLTSDKVLVLMYHRIANLTCDPWQLAVSQSNFEQQLQVLKANYNPISISELVTLLNKKIIKSNAVCITFDDGYGDNYLAAKPLLEKYECPAAFFIASHYVDAQQCFWWDELAAIILGSEILPDKLSITFNEQLFVFQLESDSVLTNEQRAKQRNWVWTSKPPNKRCELYLAFCEHLRPLPHGEIQAVIEKVKSWAGFNKVVKEDLPMTNRQLKNLADSSLFDIALHTVTHPSLAFHAADTQLKEIIGNEKYLADNCGKLTRMLAYPFGDYNKETLSVVKKQSLGAAFTTRSNPITNRSDIYQLGRFQVRNWDGEEFKRQLLKWTGYV